MLFAKYSEYFQNTIVALLYHYTFKYLNSIIPYPCLARFQFLLLVFIMMTTGTRINIISLWFILNSMFFFRDNRNIRWLTIEYVHEDVFILFYQVFICALNFSGGLVVNLIFVFFQSFRKLYFNIIFTSTPYYTLNAC